MKLAWLCYTRAQLDDPLTEDSELLPPDIKFEQPSEWEYDKIVPIVYAVIET